MLDTSSRNKNEPHELRGKINESIEMKCATSGYPLTSIIWKSLKNNQSLIAHVDISNITSTTLISSVLLYNLTKSNSGNYSCELSQNSNQRKLFHLIIQSIYTVILNPKLLSM